MAPPPKNQAEIDARNRYNAYRRGWKDAALMRHAPTAIESHPDPEMVAAYRRGREDYDLATMAAFREARDRFRLPGTEESDILRTTSSAPATPSTEPIEEAGNAATLIAKVGTLKAQNETMRRALAHIAEGFDSVTGNPAAMVNGYFVGVAREALRAIAGGGK